MKRKAVHNIGQIIFYLFVILFVGIIILPFLWQFLTSIKPLSEISAIPAKWIPSEINIQYYFNIFQKHPFFRYYCSALYHDPRTSGRSFCSVRAREIEIQGKETASDGDLKYFHVPGNRDIEPDLSAGEAVRTVKHISGSDYTIYNLRASDGDLASDKLFRSASQRI